MKSFHYSSPGSLTRAALSLWGLALAGVIRADDLSRFDFSLRFPAAISRFASFGDVAGLGGAQAAFPWSSSVNPASAAWPHPSLKTTVSMAPQFALLHFDAGTELQVFSETLSFDAGPNGVFLPSLAQIRSNHEVDRNGLGFRFDADYYQLQWGKVVMKDWAIGANFNVTVSEATSDISGMTVGRARGESYNVRIGVLHQVRPKIRVGAVFDYAFAPARTNVAGIDPSTSRFVEIQSEDTTHQVLLRTGVAWEYAPGSSLLVDYQGGIFANDSGTLRVHRFPIGVEYMVLKDALFVRAGTTVDTRGHVAFTGGVGVYPSKHFGVDVGYQYDMFPEVRPEFGSSDGWVVSVSVSF